MAVYSALLHDSPGPLRDPFESVIPERWKICQNLYGYCPLCRVLFCRLDDQKFGRTRYASHLSRALVDGHWTGTSGECVCPDAEVFNTPIIMNGLRKILRQPTRQREKVVFPVPIHMSL